MEDFLRFKFKYYLHEKSFDGLETCKCERIISIARLFSVVRLCVLILVLVKDTGKSNI